MKLSVDLQYVHDNQHLPFNNVYTNIRGEYDVVNSVFVCQTPGVYMFQNTILANPNFDPIKVREIVLQISKYFGNEVLKVFTCDQWAKQSQFIVKLNKF